ncbi:MAG: hypothetical protein QOD07_2571 [Frankiaceae bacterium]|jgi:hypothetical protein|nr:hypothetical protein [Frankiaceae bacterium]
MGRRPRTLPVAAAILGLGGLAGLAACGGGHHPKAVASPSVTAPSPTATPTSTPVAAPVTCPLTGLAPGRGQDPHRPALAVKIDNVDVSRPQAGIGKADVVVEELVEGGLTRLFAVFQCDGAPRIEPVRSARTSDADLLALLHGSVFAFSGANPAALPPIRKVGDTVMISASSAGQFFRRDGSRPAPHNEYAASAPLVAAGLARRPGLVAPPPMFRYGVLDVAAARPARVVAVRWPAASAAWTWQGGGWQRTQNGTPDLLADGHRVSAANVVIMSIRLGSTGIRDVLGNASPLDVTVGPKRPVWVLRDGRVVRGTWERRSISTGWVLLDPRGNPIALKPGRTWVELLPSPAVPVIR